MNPGYIEVTHDYIKYLWEDEEVTYAELLESVGFKEVAIEKDFPLERKTIYRALHPKFNIFGHLYYVWFTAHEDCIILTEIIDTEKIWFLR